MRGREPSRRAQSKVFEGKDLVTGADTFCEYVIGCVYLLFGSSKMKILNRTSE